MNQHVSSEKCSSHYVSLPAALMQLNKRTSTIKVAIMEIMDDSHYEWKSSRAYHKIDTFHGEQMRALVSP